MEEHPQRGPIEPPENDRTASTSGQQPPPYPSYNTPASQPLYPFPGTPHTHANPPTYSGSGQYAAPSQPMYPLYNQQGNPPTYPSSPSQNLYPPPTGAQYGQPSRPLYETPGQPAYPSYGQGQYPAQGQPPYPSFPGAAYPSVPLFGQQSSGGMPPVPPVPPVGYGAPPPPPRKRLKAWQWVLIAVGSVLLLCCVVAAIGAAASNGSPSSQTASQPTGVSATDTPEPTATPAPTDTPAPTPTPVPPGTGDHMALGHDYKQDSGGGFVIVGPADTFSSSDQFAYAVNLDQGIGTTQAKLVLVQEESGGAESAVLTVPMTISNPNYSAFANKFATSSLMYGDAPGKYKIEIETDTAVVASETFTYNG